MPDPNGLQANRYLKKDPETTDILIIIVSDNKQACEQFLATKQVLTTA